MELSGVNGRSRWSGLETTVIGLQAYSLLVW